MFHGSALVNSVVLVLGLSAATELWLLWLCLLVKMDWLDHALDGEAAYFLAVVDAFESPSLVA